MDDLLILIKNFLQDNAVVRALSTNVQIVRGVKYIDVLNGFPAIGILDGGDDTRHGGSEDLNTERVFLVSYYEELGDAEAAVVGVRLLLKKAVAEISKDDNFTPTTGVFAGYENAVYKSSTETRPGETISQDKKHLAIKLARVDFVKSVSEI